MVPDSRHHHDHRLVCRGRCPASGCPVLQELAEVHLHTLSDVDRQHLYSRRHPARNVGLRTGRRIRGETLCGWRYVGAAGFTRKESSQEVRKVVPVQHSGFAAAGTQSQH